MAATQTLTFNWKWGSLSLSYPVDVTDVGGSTADIVTNTGVTAQSNPLSIIAAKTTLVLLVSNTDLTVKTNSPGVNEVQTVTIGGSPTGGTFTLSFGGQTTAGIAFNAAATAAQSALIALSSIGTGNVAVTGSAGGPYTVTFTGTLAATNVAQMTASAAGLTGGTPTATVATTTPGVSPQETIGLLAGIPRVWHTNIGTAFPFAGDVTNVYTTNASGQQSTLKVRWLSHP